jgi:hypothetical protein
MIEEIYYFNNEPLELSYLNAYSLGDKIEIIKQIENDFNNGMLSVPQMRWIVNNGRYGSWTVMKLIDRLMFTGKLKANPITNTDRTFYKKPMPFDL